MRRSVLFGSRKVFGGILIGLVGCLAIVALVTTMSSSAATPSSGTISPAAAVLNYDAGPFLVANQSPLGLGQLDSGPRCNGTTFPCDNYTLTISLPAGYVGANPNAAVKVTMYWTDTGSKQSDYDLYIYQGVVDTLGGSQAASYSSASGVNPEVAIISPLKDGDNKYSIKIVPYVPTAETVHVRMELDSGTGPAGFPGFGLPDPTAPGIPRYQIFETPAGSTAEGFQGEMNIGFNPASGRILTMNSGPIWRLTLPERLAAAKPECCEGLWEDVTNLTTITGVDPILWTDQKSGRTFASNSTAGTNGVYGYSDNDGDLWNPLSASPPNASSDHETIGSGPYPASLSVLANPVNHGQAVYYCAQTFPVGAAACQRSDTLGSNYGPSTLPYTGNNGDPCHGIHGHVHVGPDGTVYLPIRDCGGNAGLAVSTDGGVNWTERIIPNSKTQTHGSDPSVAIGANNTVYFFYVASNADSSEGHIHVQVSKDRGANWSKDTDLGTSHGIINVAFPEAVAGDDNRAACGFLGTDRPGFYEGPTFPGIWYLFIATTYDGGDTWKVVNATPNDPVQGVAGIWQGGGNQTNRNLLDFNEVTMDDKGHVLFGYDDGCVDNCVGDPTHNSYGARIRVARQIGGKGLLSQFDPVEPAAPKRACLSGTRDPLASHLTWKVPDNSGADIVNYQIFRGTSAGAETLIGQTGGPKPSYNDTTADPSVTHYFYVVKAMNSAGAGLESNEVDLVAAPLPPEEHVCIVPGLTKLTDAAGDTSVALGFVNTPAPAGSDLLSFQLAQPYAADGIPKLVFTVNTDAGQSPQPPGSSWYVAMKIINGDTTRYAGVHLTWKSTAPTFESYVPDTNSGGGVDGRFIVPGSEKPAEASSSYAAPFNKVIIVVKASDLGLSAGDTINGFVSGVSQTDPVIGGATPLYDQMPNSLAFAGSYTIGDNAACANASPTPTPTPSPAPTLSVGSPPVTFSAGPFLVPNPTDQVNGVPTCDGTLPCSDSILNVDVPPGYDDQHYIKVQVNWTNPAAQFDLFVYSLNGDGSIGKLLAANFFAVNPDVVTISAISGKYLIRVSPTIPLGDSYTGKVTLEQKVGAATQGGISTPTFQDFQAPSTLGNSAGEPSIGVALATAQNPQGRAMYQAGTSMLRVTFDDSKSPVEALWENKSAPNAPGSLDPILSTDRQTGRTFTSQLAGACSKAAYTDTASPFNDGDQWVPSQGCGFPAGIDHQTMGAGSLHAPLTTGVAYPNGVYYCSQYGTNAASCALSVDGGLTFGPAMPIYTVSCFGIHGHVKVAPDGTVYVPDSDCSSAGAQTIGDFPTATARQALVFSEDNGITWSQPQLIPDSNPAPGIVDPSIGIGSNGTIYYGYANSNGAPSIVVGHLDKANHKIVWSPSQDVGTPFGIKNATFPAVVAGDDDRAAFAFLGTPTGGYYQDPTNPTSGSGFQGVWHLYVAYTYNGGQTWTTVDATPNDPVQRGSICNSGTVICSHAPNDRNLLDFIDASVDRQGRVLVAYADGCITSTCINAGPNDYRTNDYKAKASIARQSGGRGLFAAFDGGNPTPTPTPTPAPTPDVCLTTALVIPDAANDQSGGAADTQLDITSVSIAENYDFLGFDQLAFTMKVANLSSIPPSAVWRTRFTVGAQAYFVSMNSNSNSVVTFEYGIQNGSTVSTVGAPDFAKYSTDGTIQILLNKRRVGNPVAGGKVTAVSGATQVFAGAAGTGGFLNLDSTNAADYTMTGKPGACTQVPRPGTAPADYVKGGIGFSANVPLKAPVAGRDGEPSLRVDKFGNAYVAGIRGVPAGVDLWYFDLQPNSQTYDPLMRNPIYRGQPDQFSPDDSLSVGADGGGDVDLAVGFDESSPGNAPYLAFTSLVAANISSARSSDRGQTFVKNPIGNVTGGAPGDDRQWLEFYGKDKVYLLYRTLAPAVTQIQRSEDGGLTYGPSITAGTIGQVGSIDVDQTDGTVYISGSNGDVAVGIPTVAGLPPLSYTVHHVADGVGNLFFVIKAADDKDAAGNHVGTVYVAYSDGLDIYIKYSKDKGNTWSNAIRVSDGPDAHTNLLPWLETGPVPGSIGVVWYGTSEEFNNDNANWKAFFAQSLNATDPTPTFRQVEISDHVIHGSNISLGGLLGSANRNLLDYFQVAFDPTGAAVVAFTDDHNDFDGHTYVARQIAGPSVKGGSVPTPVEGNSLPAPAPTPSADAPQVMDWAQDMRQGGNSQVGGLIVTPINDPVDIVSIRYATEPGTNGPVISVTMKVSDLSITPPSSTWRMNFTANAPDTRLSPNGLYNFGLSDRGDQFYLRASTDALGATTYAYGTAQRLSTGGITYTDRGVPDAGSFNAAANSITIKISVSKLNAILSAAGRPTVGPGSAFAGLRGSAFTTAQGNNFKSDSTRGGTLFRIDTPPTAVLSATPTSGYVPLNVNLDGSCSTDPDPGDVLTYTFDFGDGSPSVSQSDPKVSHTYNQVGSYVATLKVKDASGFESNTATIGITVNAPPPPISVCYEDDDAHIAYSGGWHLVSSNNASSNHFRLHNGSDTTHFASLTVDVPAGQTGTLTYTYAKSTKGGSAQVFIDGVSKGTISYRGLNGGMRDPEFKSGGIPYSVTYTGLGAGQHKFELRNLTDSVYIDNICVQSAVSNSQPATGPGQTSTNSSAVNAGQQSSSSPTLPSNANEISVLAEASGGLPIKLLLVDPAGLTLKTVDSFNGIAVLSAPVTQGGLYTIKVVNVSLGPVQVWTVATPTVVR